MCEVMTIIYRIVSKGSLDFFSINGKNAVKLNKKNY